jgi:hypothetical protein
MGRHGGRPSLEMLQWVKRSTKPDWLHLRGDQFYGEVVSLTPAIPTVRSEIGPYRPSQGYVSFAKIICAGERKKSANAQ